MEVMPDAYLLGFNYTPLVLLYARRNSVTRREGGETTVLEEGLQNTKTRGGGALVRNLDIVIFVENWIADRDG